MVTALTIMMTEQQKAKLQAQNTIKTCNGDQKLMRCYKL